MHNGRIYYKNPNPKNNSDAESNEPRLDINSLDVDPLLGLPVGRFSGMNSSGIEMDTLDRSTDDTTDTIYTSDSRDTRSSGNITSSNGSNRDSSENGPENRLQTIPIDDQNIQPQPIVTNVEIVNITDSPESDTVSDAENEELVQPTYPPINSDELSESTESFKSAKLPDSAENDEFAEPVEPAEPANPTYQPIISLPPTPEELERAEILQRDREARLRAARAFAASTTHSYASKSHSGRSVDSELDNSPAAQENTNASSLFGSGDSVSSTASTASWGDLFQQSASFLSSATRVVAKSAVDLTKRIGTEYEARVPEHMKEKISNSASAVVSTTKVLAKKSAEIFDKNVRPTIYNSTIGHFYTSELTHLLLLEIPENSIILDVGIGTAYSYCQNASLLKSRKIKIVGVDIDESYILRARHLMIDYDLTDHIELICGDIYQLDLNNRTFDYVVFSDSYAVIPNVNNMMRHCERFMNEFTGYMIVTSTLFDEYDATLDRIKQNLKYVSAIEYGQLMLRSDLESYIVSDRHSDDYEFKLVKKFNIGNMEFNSYIVRWRPGDMD